MMEKPEGFKYTIPMSEWPQEWKDYRWYCRTVNTHPEWKDLTLEEVKEKSKESKANRGRNNIAKWHESYQDLPEEEKERINRSKGNGWKNLTEEERAAKSRHMQEISQNFWDGMSEEERAAFVTNRESGLTEQQKANRKIAGTNNLIAYNNSLTDEEKRENGRRLAEYSHALYHTDPEYRERQLKQLAEAREIYNDSLTPERRAEIGERSSLRWENLPEEEKQKYSERTTQRNYEWWENHPERRKENKVYYPENASVDSYFWELRKISFPYPKYTDDEMMTSWRSLVDLACTTEPHQNLSANLRTGDKLIRNFHPSIYHAHREGKLSPYDAWYNDNLLKMAIDNRIKYNIEMTPANVLQGFSAAKIAPKVTVFSAAIAKMLIMTYLKDATEIFDPFSGFSGRMLGTVALGKKYTGIDLSDTHVRESEEIVHFLKTHGVHIDATLLEWDVMKASGSYDALFTCPPYGTKEVWEKSNGEQLTCDEWIDVCLNRFNCKKYLFVVDKTEKYKDHIVDEIVNQSHLGTNIEHVVLIERK